MIPIPLSWWAIGGLGLALAGTVGVEEYRINSRDELVAEWTAKYEKEHGLRQQDRAEANDANAKLTADYRKRENDLRLEFAGVIDAANEKNRKLETALARADSASRSLSGTVATLKTAARTAAANTSDPGRCETALATNDLFSRMLERLDNAAGGFAAYADKLRIANETCVSAYGHAQEALAASAVSADAIAASAAASAAP